MNNKFSRVDMAWARKCKTATCKIVKRSNNICPTGYLLNKRGRTLFIYVFSAFLQIEHRYN